MTLEQYHTKFEPEFRRCLKLLDIKDNSESYCLVYKERINHCPPKCGYFEEGEVGTIENVEKRKLDYKCLYFSRINEKQDYFCIFFEQESPFCEFCQFAKHKA